MISRNPKDIAYLFSDADSKNTLPLFTRAVGRCACSAASQWRRAGQLPSFCIFLPLWKEDSGVKFVVTALTSYRIHGFSIAWRIRTLRRRKPTRGTGSKVHVWSTSTGASQTPAWVEHPTYMPNATGFIVAKKLRKQNCLALSLKWPLKDIWWVKYSGVLFLIHKVMIQLLKQS